MCFLAIEIFLSRFPVRISLHFLLTLFLLGMALLGCDVISTDQVEVLPLLTRNVERNTSRIIQMNPGLGAHKKLF